MELAPIDKIKADNGGGQHKEHGNAGVGDEIRKAQPRGAANHNIGGGADQGGGARPMLEAMIWVMKKGMGLIRSMLVMARVMGPMRSTVVTLSRKADKTAVIKANNTISGQGRPLAIFRGLNGNVFKDAGVLTTATKSIMPHQDPRY